jgi:hypothetical protein
MSEVLVRGRVEDHLTPDVAVLTVTVVGRDPTGAEAAVAAAAGVGQRVDAVLERARAGEDPLVRRLRVSSVRTSEMWEHPQGRAHRSGFQAVRRSEVECGPDGPGLTTLVADLSAAGAQLTGPAWQVLPDNPGWPDLRSRAVADARARAEVYAAAVGARIGGARWLAEPGLRGSGGTGSRVEAVQRMAAAFGGGGEAEPVALRVVVEDVPVIVEIEAAFDLRPDLA